MDRLRRTLTGFYLFSFFRSLSFLGAVMVPFFTDWGHISQFWIQLLQSWFLLWIFLLEVPTGVIADRFSRKLSVGLGVAVLIGGMLLYGSVPRLEIFFLAESLFAIAIALMSGADDALLYDMLKEQGREGEARHICGRVRAIELTAMFLAAPVGSMLAARWGMNAPMLFSAVPIALAGCVLLFIPEPRFHGQRETRRYAEILRSGFRHLRSERRLQLVALDAVGVSASAYFVLWLYQPLLRGAGVSIVWFGVFHAFLVGSQIIVAASLRRLERLLGSWTRLLRFGAAITALSFLLVALLPCLPTIVVFLCCAGGFGLSRFELMTAHMNELIPSAERATVLSFISMLRRLATCLLNPCVGLLVVASLPAALLFAGIPAAVIFLFAPVQRARRLDS